MQQHITAIKLFSLSAHHGLQTLQVSLPRREEFLARLAVHELRVPFNRCPRTHFPRIYHPISTPTTRMHLCTVSSFSGPPLYFHLSKSPIAFSHPVIPCPTQPRRSPHPPLRRLQVPRRCRRPRPRSYLLPHGVRGRHAPGPPGAHLHLAGHRRGLRRPGQQGAAGLWSARPARARREDDARKWRPGGQVGRGYTSITKPHCLCAGGCTAGGAAAPGGDAGGVRRCCSAQAHDLPAPRHGRPPLWPAGGR